jgi:hypothetical protein
MSESKTTGHCYCGAIQLEISGQPLWIEHCHCESCRRHTGSMMSTFVGYRPDQVDYTSARPASLTTDDGITRCFCGQCGSPVSYEPDRRENEIHLYLGILDEPDKFHPEDHVHYEEKVTWLEIKDKLPRYDGITGSNLESDG